MAPCAKSWRTRFAIWRLTASLLLIVSASHEAAARISFASCSAVPVSWGKEFKHAVPIAHALLRFPNRERSKHWKDFPLNIYLMRGGLASGANSCRQPGGPCSRRKVSNQIHKSRPVVMVLLFLGGRIVLFDHEVDRHTVQLLEHKRSVDHRIFG